MDRNMDHHSHASDHAAKAEADQYDVPVRTKSIGAVTHLVALGYSVLQIGEPATPGTYQFTLSPSAKEDYRRWFAARDELDMLIAEHCRQRDARLPRTPTNLRRPTEPGR